MCYDYLTSILETLYWLPVRYRIQCKIIHYQCTKPVIYLRLAASPFCSSSTSQAKHCDRHRNLYWLHISANTVIQRSSSLLLTYRMIFHPMCENVTQYTILEDSLNITYAKELFPHELWRTVNIVARLDYLCFQVLLSY